MPEPSSESSTPCPVARSWTAYTVGRHTRWRRRSRGSTEAGPSFLSDPLALLRRLLPEPCQPPPEPPPGPIAALRGEQHAQRGTDDGPEQHARKKARGTPPGRLPSSARRRQLVRFLDEVFLELVHF